MKYEKDNLVFNFNSIPAFAGDKIGSDCTLKGKKLSGKIRFVENFEDFKIRVVSANEDLRVEVVTYPTKDCGKWEYVQFFENFKVKIVNANEDFTIRYVIVSPGVR